MGEEEVKYRLFDEPDDLQLVADWQVQFWWFLVAAGFILLVIAGVLFMKRRRKAGSGVSDEQVAYEEARQTLNGIEGEVGARAAATEVSLVLRRYLARSLGEPALFETQEETLGRHDSLVAFPEELRERLSGYFADLGRNKYALGSGESGDGRVFVAQGRDLLEELHRA